MYREKHSVTTSDDGQINLVVGNGTSDLGNFESIDWGTDSKFIKIEIDAGDGFADMGTFQLLSVPFALYAKNVENTDDADADNTNEIQDISLTGTNLSITNGSTVDLSAIQDGVDQTATRVRVVNPGPNQPNHRIRQDKR